VTKIFQLPSGSEKAERRWSEKSEEKSHCRWSRRPEE